MDLSHLLLIEDAFTEERSVGVKGEGVAKGAEPVELLQGFVAFNRGELGENLIREGRAGGQWEWVEGCLHCEG